MIEQEIYNDIRELIVLMAFGTQQLLRPYDLTVEQYDTLLVLQLDAGWRMGDLTQKILSDNSKMTRIVDYLEGNGWAERRPDPDDRRAQQVFLTTSGAALRDAVKVEHDALLQSWLSLFSAEQKAQLQAQLDQFRNHLRAQTVEG